jgi:hypothetical protein
MSKKHPGRPRNEDKPKCKVEGCQKLFFAKGFCSTHYMYLRRGIVDTEGNRLREPQRIARYASDAKCMVAGCADFPRSRGMCNKHMLQRDAGIIDAQGTQLRELLPFSRPRTRDKWVQESGYVLVQAPEGHPFARQDGSILEHRLVMEQVLGHFLDPDEFLVHHKDGNRGNNQPDNLVVLSAHAKKGEGHPPGSEISRASAVQVLLQQTDLPTGLKDWLEWYRTQ